MLKCHVAAGIVIAVIVISIVASKEVARKGPAEPWGEHHTGAAAMPKNSPEFTVTNNSIQSSLRRPNIGRSKSLKVWKFEMLEASRNSVLYKLIPCGSFLRKMLAFVCCPAPRCRLQTPGHPFSIFQTFNLSNFQTFKVCSYMFQTLIIPNFRDP